MLETLLVNRNNLQKRFRELHLEDIEMKHLDIGDKKNVPRIIFSEGKEYWQKKVLKGESPDLKDNAR